MTRPAPASVRPLALGYLRLYASDPPDVALRLAAELHLYAEKEGLTLADAFVDLFDPPAAAPSNRAGFCALMDTLRRTDAHAIIIPTPVHLSRRPSGYCARRTIIETEGNAGLLVVSPGDGLR